jgi:glyoxylase-like metal-dependent hydrolase (beta-lactamase superfamily II)
MMVGTIEVTTLLDGFFPMKPLDFMKNANAKKVHELLAKSDQGDVILTSDNAFLINTGSKLVLVDAGCGSFFGPSFGHVVENLKAAGYTPDQVDEILITHMHTDHLGGIVADGKAVFPHAVLRMDQKEADFWLNPENAKKIIAKAKDMFPQAAAAVAPYKSADRLKPFQGETEITTGIKAIPAPGHTPGHTAYAIESAGKKLLLVGDLFHVEALEFPNPEFKFIAETNDQDSIASKKRIFKEASDQGYPIGAAHLPFPGIGHVVAAKPGYRYLPIPYAPVQQ